MTVQCKRDRQPTACLVDDYTPRKTASAEYVIYHPRDTQAREIPNMRLPMAVCAAVAEVLDGSHPTLDALFEAAGAPGPPPDLAHHSKWKNWLHRAGNDPNVNSLAVLGNLIEEFMDLPPPPATAEIYGVEHDPIAVYDQKRARLNAVLEQHGLF